MKAAYSLALMSVDGGSYLIDVFGVGIGPIEKPKEIYNQPVYQVEGENSPIGFRARLIGNFPIGSDSINSLIFSHSMDLAQFIEQGPDCDQRLERWAHFWEQSRAR